ncbi:helicase SRCAP-like [Anopheles nili]|uniref:helicase SRCAP-like n=1 Tax=Anopheles nili TaxID=185578 RepID=UPI00237AA9BC|nr:helicase SRCAP-like [Anopheles nili]
MKVLIATMSLLVALASAQQQLIDPYFNEGLVQYADWQPNLVNSYGLPQFLPAQQFPLVPGASLPPVPVPFPAQLPLPVPYPAQLPYQLPVPVRPQLQQQPQQLQLPGQVQLVRHGLPHSDAAAVSYSSLHYSNGNPQTPQTTNVATPGTTLQTPPVAPSTGVAVAPATPTLTGDKLPVVKDIASFGTEYGTGNDKGPVARYEAINAGSVHVAPLPGHTVDQKLVAPGTVDQKL